MAAAIVHVGLGMVELDTTNSDFTPTRPVEVEHVMFEASATGEFAFTLNGVAMSLRLGGADSFLLPLNRVINAITLTSAPADGKLYAFLREISSGA